MILHVANAYGFTPSTAKAALKGFSEADIQALRAPQREISDRELAAYLAHVWLGARAKVFGREAEIIPIKRRAK
jgi:hypothetical protein